MSFAKFLQGALQGATEAMPAAFQRHDDRKRFEEQMQLERTQFGEQIRMQEAELGEARRRNQVLETYNTNKLELDREFAQAQDEDRDREWFTSRITASQDPSSLEALDGMLVNFSEEDRKIYSPIIEAQRQGIAYAAQLHEEEMVVKDTMARINQLRREGNWDQAEELAASMSLMGLKFNSLVESIQAQRRIGSGDLIQDQRLERFLQVEEILNQRIAAMPQHASQWGPAKMTEERDKIIKLLNEQLGPLPPLTAFQGAGAQVETPPPPPPAPTPDPVPFLPSGGLAGLWGGPGEKPTPEMAGPFLSNVVR